MARMTLEQLWISSARLSPWRRNYSQSPKRQINQIIPFVGTKTLLFTGSFWGLTEKAIHLSSILFMGCEIIEEQAQPTPPVQTQEPTIISDEEVSVAAEQQPYGGIQLPYDSSTHFMIPYQGRNYWVRKIDMKKQPVVIRCSCSDYFFSFSYANYLAGVQFGGRARPYIRKTTHYPRRNPQNIVGGCKHVVGQFAQMLQTSGYTV